MLELNGRIVKLNKSSEFQTPKLVKETEILQGIGDYYSFFNFFN